MEIKYGSILKNVLEEKNISQKELAQKIETTEATISKYINNLQMPRLDLVDRISKILNVSTDYLLGRTEKNNKEINFDKIKDEMTFSTRLKGDWNKLSSDEQKKIESEVNEYAEYILKKYLNKK